MSSSISTLEELSSSGSPTSGRAWRLVEAQNQISTAKLTDTADEQRALELLIEDTKPSLPPECRHLHFLLSTPFRYGAPYPRGSRFRRAGFTLGVFYASEHVHAAVAELCFYRLLFFSESPDTKWPADAGEFTAFAVELAGSSVDLTLPPFSSREAEWRHPTKYEACQDLADLARKANVHLVKYLSVRDPSQRKNIAILSGTAFTNDQPISPQTWRLFFNENGARALCEMPRDTIDFSRSAFADDPRLSRMKWVR
jgi:RES domain-containing protein